MSEIAIIELCAVVTVVALLDSLPYHVLLQ